MYDYIYSKSNKKEYETTIVTRVKERFSHESRESHQGDKTVLDTDACKNRSLHDIKIQLKYEIDRYINFLDLFKFYYLRSWWEKVKVAFKRIDLESTIKENTISKSDGNTLFSKTHSCRNKIQ